MSNELLDEAGVAAKFGVPPAQMVDYLALVGDTVDGVPGVQKCGPKTAVKWLEQYGSLDGIVAHADEIGGVVGQNLRDHLDFLPLGRKLVTVVCDLPTCRPRTTDRHAAATRETLRELLRALRIPHLAARTGQPRPPTPPPSEPATASAHASAATRRRQLRNRPHLGAIRRLAGQDRSRRTHRARHRNHQPRPLRRAHCRHFARRSTPGEACYIPLAHTAPASPTSCRATKCWPG